MGFLPMCMSVHHTYEAPAENKSAFDPLGLDCCESPCGCWELNLGHGLLILFININLYIINMYLVSYIFPQHLKLMLNYV